MRLTREKIYPALLRFFVESLERIVGRGIRALCYASGKETGRKLADGVKVRSIDDALMLIEELFNGEMIIQKLGGDEIIVEQSPIFELRDNVGNVIPGLVFFNDGLVAGLLESLLNTRLEVIPTYKQNSDDELSTRKILCYENKKTMPISA